MKKKLVCRIVVLAILALASIAIPTNNHIGAATIPQPELEVSTIVGPVITEAEPTAEPGTLDKPIKLNSAQDLIAQLDLSSLAQTGWRKCNGGSCGSSSFPSTCEGTRKGCQTIPLFSGVPLFPILRIVAEDGNPLLLFTVDDMSIESGGEKLQGLHEVEFFAKDSQGKVYLWTALINIPNQQTELGLTNLSPLDEKLALSFIAGYRSHETTVSLATALQWTTEVESLIVESIPVRTIAD